MNKLLTAFLAIGSLLTYSAQAQQLRGSSELAILSQSNVGTRDFLNSAASVQQNQTTTLQRGTGNQVFLNPQQGENDIRLIQNGNFNAIDAQLLGENSRVQLFQQGDRNILDIRNVQTTNNTLQVMQRGDNNELVDYGSGLLNRSIRIEQSGGMKLIVQ